MSNPSMTDTPESPTEAPGDPAQAVAGSDGSARSLSSLGDLAVIGLFFILAFAIMKLMAELLVPMVSAVIIGSVLARIGDRWARYGVPPMVAALALVLLTGGTLFLVVDALFEPLATLIVAAPAILTRVGEAVTPLLEPITSLKRSILHMSENRTVGAILVGSETAWVSGALAAVTPAVGELFIFFTTLVFFIGGRVALRRRLIMAWGGHTRRLAAIRVINAIEGALALYFGTTATIYAVVGSAAAAIAFASGLGSPLLWGALTFAASFIPYFGAAIITLALAAGGLIAHDQIGWALMPAAAFLVLHLISENAVIPTFLGRRLDINPFVVFIAIVFWTWMWGAVGAVLAVPLLLIGETIIGELRRSPPDRSM